MPSERAFAHYRRERGLSLDQAAARLRISPGYLKALEAARVPLSLPLAGRMALEYSVSLQALTTPDRVGRTGTGGVTERNRHPAPVSPTAEAQFRTSELPETT